MSQRVSGNFLHFSFSSGRHSCSVTNWHWSLTTSSVLNKTWEKINYNLVNNLTLCCRQSPAEDHSCSSSDPHTPPCHGSHTHQHTSHHTLCDTSPPGWWSSWGRWPGDTAPPALVYTPSVGLDKPDHHTGQDIAYLHHHILAHVSTLWLIEALRSIGCWLLQGTNLLSIVVNLECRGWCQQ